MIYIRAKRTGECKGGITVCVKCRDCDCTEIKDISLKDLLYESDATIEDCYFAFNEIEEENNVN